jgi:hypothetical protein
MSNASSTPNGSSGDPSAHQPPTDRPGGWFDRIERIGNALPEPALIFAILSAVVIVVSAIGVAADWRIQPIKPKAELVEKVDRDGAPVLDAAFARAAVGVVVHRDGAASLTEDGGATWRAVDLHGERALTVGFEVDALRLTTTGGERVQSGSAFDAAPAASPAAPIEDAARSEGLALTDAEIDALISAQ